jgi:hypothetical protein
VVFSGYSGSSTKKSDYHDMTEILLKMTLSTITLSQFGTYFREPPEILNMLIQFECYLPTAMLLLLGIDT